MGEAQPRIAVLSIGSPAQAPEPTVVLECLRAAGAVVSTSARIDSFVPLVRQKLAAWVADAAVDAIAIHDGTNEGVGAAALAPLVSESLGGLAESAAEVMRCKTTLVFLLPATPEAQRRAFERLFRPALDKHRHVAAPAAAVAIAPAEPAPDAGASDPVMELDALGAEELASSTADLVAVSDAMIETSDAAPRPSRTTSSRLPGVVQLSDDPPAPPAAAITPPRSHAVTRTPQVSREDDASTRPAPAMFTMPRASIGLVPKLLAGAAVLAIGAVIAVLWMTRQTLAPAPTIAMSDPRTPREPAPAAVPPSPPAPVVAIDAATDDIELDPTTTTPPPTPPTPPTTTPRTDRGNAPALPPQPAHVLVAPPAHGEATPPITEPPAEPPAPPAAEGCDQVSCVLDQYSRACCEPFKPKITLPVRSADGVPQTLDKMSVRAAIEPMKPVVIACGEKAAVSGTVKVALDVAPDGSVTSASVTETPDAALGTCVANALHKVHFEKTHDGASFVYPFVF